MSGCRVMGATCLAALSLCVVAIPCTGRAAPGAGPMPPMLNDGEPPPSNEDGTIYLWTGVAITSAVSSYILWGWGADAAADRDAAWDAWHTSPDGSPAEGAALRRFRESRLHALGYFVGGCLTATLAATASGLALYGWLSADEQLEVTPGPGGMSLQGRF